MKIYIRKLYSFLIVFIAAVFLFPAACSMGGGDDGDDPPVDNPAKGEMTAATAAKIFNYTVEAGSIKITLFKDTAELSSYLGGSASLVLNTIGGRPVSVIAAGAFNKTSGGAEALSTAGVRGVRLPETLTDIDPNSFTGAGITVLIVPASVVSDIGSQVFDDLETNSGAELIKVSSSGSILVADDVDMAKIGVNPTWPLDGDYELAADITLENWMPIGAAAEQPFTGTFYGSGKKITLNGFDPEAQDITVEFEGDGISEITPLGLFWRSNDNAVIKDFALALNLGTESIPLSLTSAATDIIFGGVVGVAETTTIQNITVSGNFIADRTTGGLWIGGIAGGAFETVISGCASSLKIEATAAAGEVSAGGIAGACWGEGSKIENSHTIGDIRAEGTGGEIGGIVGHFEASIIKCSATGNVSAFGTTERTSAGGIAGAFCGEDRNGSIAGSFAAGDVSAVGTANADADAGGIAGTIYCKSGHSVTLRFSYATGDVSSSVTHTDDSAASGGLFGEFNTPNSGIGGTVTVEKCYAAGNVSSDSATTSSLYAGGITGISNPLVSGTIVIKACAALNQGITGLNYSIGRVAGLWMAGGSLENNIAYAGMTLNGDATVSSGDTHDGKNGASKATGELEDQATWTSLFGSASFGNSDSAPWEWDSTAKLPKLYWQQ